MIGSAKVSVKKHPNLSGCTMKCCRAFGAGALIQPRYIGQGRKYAALPDFPGDLLGRAKVTLGMPRHEIKRNAGPFARTPQQSRSRREILRRGDVFERQTPFLAPSFSIVFGSPVSKL